MYFPWFGLEIIKTCRAEIPMTLEGCIVLSVAFVAVNSMAGAVWATERKDARIFWLSGGHRHSFMQQ